MAIGSKYRKKVSSSAATHGSWKDASEKKNSFYIISEPETVEITATAMALS